MIHITEEIPRKVAVAVSGGIDSMAVLDFLRRSHEVVALHFNHGTPYAPDAEKHVRYYCDENNIFLITGRSQEKMPDGVSKEAWWREQRYKFFEEATNLPIVTAHHLDDVVENWIFTSLNGNPFLIPSRRGKYIRPFLTTDKQDFTLWCIRKHVSTIGDPSNDDTKFRRNYIRHTMMPHILQINPGIKKTLKKKILDRQRSPG